MPWRDLYEFHTNFQRETFETLYSLEIDLFILIDLYVLYCVLCIESFQ